MPFGRSYVFGLLSTPILFTPILTADFKSVEEQDWHINTNVLMGFDMSRAGPLSGFGFFSTTIMDIIRMGNSSTHRRPNRSEPAPILCFSGISGRDLRSLMEDAR